MPRPNTFQEIEQVTNADEIRQLSCSEALRNTGKDLVLFTPALLLVHGGLDRDPVIEFDARYDLPNDDFRPFAVDLKKENDYFFEGLGVLPSPVTGGKINWDKRLYAINAEYAGDCFEFIGGMCWSNPKTGLFAEVMSYDILINDPTSFTGEQLLVKIFGVMANQFVAYMEERFGARPIARRASYTDGKLPRTVPRNNFIGVRPKIDPLTMRDE